MNTSTDLFPLNNGCFGLRFVFRAAAVGISSISMSPTSPRPVCVLISFIIFCHSVFKNVIISSSFPTASCFLWPQADNVKNKIKDNVRNKNSEIHLNFVTLLLPGCTYQRLIMMSLLQCAPRAGLCGVLVDDRSKKTFAWPQTRPREIRSMTNLRENPENRFSSGPREPFPLPPPTSFFTFRPVRTLLPLTETAEWSWAKTRCLLLARGNDAAVTMSAYLSPLPPNTSWGCSGRAHGLFTAQTHSNGVRMGVSESLTAELMPPVGWQRETQSHPSPSKALAWWIGLLLFFFFPAPAPTWRGGICSTCPSWPPRGTSSTTRSTSGGGTAWVWSSTTCLATACWTLGGWWRWPRTGKRCPSVSTASPGPFRKPSESRVYFESLTFHLARPHSGIWSLAKILEKKKSYVVWKTCSSNYWAIPPQPNLIPHFRSGCPLHNPVISVSDHPSEE